MLASMEERVTIEIRFCIFIFIFCDFDKTEIVHFFDEDDDEKYIFCMSI